MRLTWRCDVYHSEQSSNLPGLSPRDRQARSFDRLRTAESGGSKWRALLRAPSSGNRVSDTTRDSEASPLAHLERGDQLAQAPLPRLWGTRRHELPDRVVAIGLPERLEGLPCPLARRQRRLEVGRH